MDLSKIDNVPIFNVVLDYILQAATLDQEVVGPETLLENISIYPSDHQALAEKLTEAIPLFTDVAANSYNSWKTVYDVYKTIERLDREGTDNPSVSHRHSKKKEA